MKLVEKHLVRPSKPFFPEIDKLAFLSKNLYNCALYQCRQAFFAGQKIPSYNRLYHLLKTGIDYRALPAKVAQLVIKQAVKCFDDYFAALRSYRQDRSKFLGEPKLPKYKHKTEGRNVLTYNNQAVSKKALAKGLIHPSGTSFFIPTQQKQVDEVRIVPKGGSYVVEVVYTVEDVTPPVKEAHTRVAGIDLGIDNLACVTSNLSDFEPFVVCGKALKSANRYYNQVKARLQKLLPSARYRSNRIQRLTRKRNSKVDYYLHTEASIYRQSIAGEPNYSIGNW